MKASRPPPQRRKVVVVRPDPDQRFHWNRGHWGLYAKVALVVIVVYLIVAAAAHPGSRGSDPTQTTTYRQPMVKPCIGADGGVYPGYTC